MGKLKNKKLSSGFLTIEIIIAMAVIVLILSGIIMVSMGNQSILVDSQTNSEALNIAQGILEKAQADVRKDFNLVNPYTQDKAYSNESSDNFIYHREVKVNQKDFFTKLVTAEVSWPSLLGKSPKVTLSTLVTNFNNAVGGDTCSSVLKSSDEWKNPEVKEKFSDFSFLAGITDNYSITDIDVYKNKLYVTIAKTTSDDTPTFFVFNIENNDTNNVDIKEITNGFIDNNTDSVTGLNAVTVAEDPTDSKTYAYVASANSAGGQLQIIDVSDTSLSIKKTVSTTGLGTGNSIFYKDGFIYLGKKSLTGGPEFSIIDVHNIDNADEVGYWPPSGSLNHEINAIYVRGNYAYLATADSKKLIVLDISNASSPKEVGVFDDGVGNNGKSIYFVGDNLYLGRTIGGNELSIIDESEPETLSPQVLGSIPDINKSVDGIIVRGITSTTDIQSSLALAFVLTPADFRIFNITDLNDIKDFGDEDLEPGTFGNTTYEPVFDCEGNNFFVGSNDDSGNGNGYLSIITPS